MATANGRFAAYTRQGKVYIQDLIPSGSEWERSIFTLPVSKEHSILSLSNSGSPLLAISIGTQVAVLDVVSGNTVRTINGNGRAVTALAWSRVQRDLLVVGTIDGTLSIWTSGAETAGVQLNLDGVCRTIECCPSDESFLACISGGRIVLLKHEPNSSLRVVRTVALNGDAICSLAWHLSNSRWLLVGTDSGILRQLDIGDAMGKSYISPNYQEDYSSDSEDGLFGDLDSLGDSVPAIFEIASQQSSMQVRWVARNAFACFSSRSTECCIYSWQDAPSKATELWSHDLHQTAHAVDIIPQDGTAFLAQVTRDDVLRTELPQHVIEEVDLSTSSNGHLTADLQKTGAPSLDQGSTFTGMMPVTISDMRSAQSSFSKTSKQLKHRKASFERKNDRTALKSTNTVERIRPASPPDPTSMTSSLELPKATDGEGSPMPFLSPSIPSRKPSPGELAALDDTIRLPSLPRASFDSMQSASTTNPESDDSDDETFVDGMHSSATFLPGGINVPLPKACAALFTPTGELLTFFPPKPKLAPSKGQAKEENLSDPKTSARKIAKLFPTFGNLVGEAEGSDEDSGFESASSVSVDEHPLRVRPSFSFFPSSFPSEQSWKARISPTKHSFTEQSPHKIIISLHDLDILDTLLPASLTLAQEYRILCEPRQDAGEVCRHNAQAAGKLGRDDTAGVWRLLALLLEDQLPPEFPSVIGAYGDIPRLARAASELSRKATQAVKTNSTPHKKLSWTNSPLGAAWIIPAILDWAEALADTQLLAVLSAILAYVQERTPAAGPLLGRSTRAQRSPYHEASHHQDYFSDARTAGHLQSFTRPSIPTFRTESTAGTQSQYRSPVKQQHASTASSRQGSQPSTPYLESGASTPPLSLPALGRQTSRLSASGSASPEHHRSSFSAAARYYAQSYAQSISDKFAASYGAYSTSPPTRKIGTSPSSANELSTSFRAGSWGKSVSFASTTNTTKASLLSTSYEEPREDQGYDSDKTVEDLSQPQTPKDVNDCVVLYKNETLFDDDVCGGTHPALLSPELITKGRAWCEYYAEQLRCWDLLAEAAELEKVCGMTYLGSPFSEAGQAGILPRIAPHGSKACSICSIKMTGAQFFCSRCSHAAHLDCLESFINALSATGEQQSFSCPAGCGCECDSVPFEIAGAEIAAVLKEERPKKKASFTDPMLWRARVEGDNSW